MQPSRKRRTEDDDDSLRRDEGEEHNTEIFERSQRVYATQRDGQLQGTRRSYKPKMRAIRTINDAPHIPNIMMMSQEDRINFIRSFPNPYGWPAEYLDIYTRERINCNPTGFDFLARIDGVKVFTGLDDQIPGKEQVKQMRNINCIKSRNNDMIDLENISFGTEVIDFLKNSGINYIGDFDEYMDYRSERDTEYQKRLGKIRAKYMKIQRKMDKDLASFLKSSVQPNYSQDMETVGMPLSPQMDVTHSFTHIESGQIEETGDNEENMENEEMENEEVEEEDFYISDRKLRRAYRNEISDLNYDFTISIKPDYDEYIRIHPQPNKYQIIIAIIKECLGEYAKYVCIAGGFSYSKYLYETYGQSTNFADIDLFIHSCDEVTANKIIPLLSKITRRGVLKNENVFMSMFESSLEYGENFLICFDGQTKSIQIIKRLYTCPSQVILGFDVDNCCILTTLDGETYATERCCYAIRNGYNVVNFDRMSPSYEWRLEKYNQRCMGIWIPFIEHFKANAVFDADRLDKTKMSSVIIASLIKNGKVGKYDKNSIKEKEVSDYYGKVGSTTEYDSSIFEEFKILNPGEQIINTFHRIVLEDPIQWYPVRGKDIYDEIIINNKATECHEIKEELSINHVSAMNIIRVNRCRNKNSLRSMISARLMIKYIDSLLPDSFISGHIVMCALNGNSGFKINLYSERIQTIEQQKLILYHVTKYRYLLACRNAMASIVTEIGDVDPLLLGTIEFSSGENVTNEFNYGMRPEGISDEENFRRFCLFSSDYPRIEILGYINNYYAQTKYIKCSSFYPSDGVITLIDKLISTPDCATNVLKIDVERDSADKIFLDRTSFHYLCVFDRFIEWYSHFFSNEMKAEIEANYHQILEYKRLDDEESFVRNLNLIRIGKSSYNRETGKNESSKIRFDLKESEDREILSRLKFMYYWKLLINGDLNALRSYCLKYFFDHIPSNVTIDFKHTLSGDFVKDDIFYNNGKYYGSEYDLHLMRIGTSHDEINHHEVKILKGPAWEQFIPL